MVNEFSSFEVILISKFLTKKPAAVIAELISRDVALVRAKISELSGKGRIGYDKKKQEKAEKKKPVKPGNKRQIPRKQFLKYLPEKKLDTKPLKLNEKIPVQIDHKTIVWINPGEDIEQVKKKYRERDPWFKKPENPAKVVKKFKPLK